MRTLLEVKDLRVAFPTDSGLVSAVSEVSFSLNRGETLAIVGESGSGKSVSSMAIMGLLNRKRTQVSGEILLHHDGLSTDLLSAEERVLRTIRGKKMAMIFQDPMSSLHPYYTINNQISEAWLIHNGGDKKVAKKRAIEMLDLVGIPDPHRRVDEFPHQFSGGMRQRVMIALALVNQPELLIADEPTTALDVTVQAQIMTLISQMQKEFNMAVVLITHDLGVVAEYSDRINVMYAGKLVEEGTTDEIFYESSHPYTVGLLNSIPRVDRAGTGKLSTIPGTPPSLINLPQGCAFSPRCSYISHIRNNACFSSQPESTEISAGHKKRCFLEEQEIRKIDLSQSLKESS